MSESALTCKEIVELVSDYLDGGLDERTARLVDEHLALCPGCDAYLDQMRQTLKVLGSVTPENLSESTRDGLLAAFRDIRPPQPKG
ncbi:zf-HC2 domain-containing protein [Specibacter cremeus]|uniref:zf-HC2 domain-containing protein n=1 Tax=Specibacter cremeus TaxID=1629051 RepID=UPI00197BFE0B|nr:zf-HC2 domain-containing protein [Specibacter cremeus]